MMLPEGYNAIIISTVVDRILQSCFSPGYNAIIISTVVDMLFAYKNILIGYNAIIISTVVDDMEKCVEDLAIMPS